MPGEQHQGPGQIKTCALSPCESWVEYVAAQGSRTPFASPDGEQREMAGVGPPHLCRSRSVGPAVPGLDGPGGVGREVLASRGPHGEGLGEKPGAVAAWSPGLVVKRRGTPQRLCGVPAASGARIGTETIGILHQEGCGPVHFKRGVRAHRAGQPVVRERQPHNGPTCHGPMQCMSMSMGDEPWIGVSAQRLSGPVRPCVTSRVAGPTDSYPV